MLGTSRGDFKSSLEHVLKRYHSIIAGVLFAAGILLRLLGTYYSGAVWEFIGELGTFLAAAIAIPFIYERFIKTEDHRLFISDLEEVLDVKLAAYRNQQESLHIYELGRMPVHEKVTFFQDANSEVIEFGLSLSTFASFFEQRPVHEYKKPVMDLLRRGVQFRCLVLDPDSDIAAIYAQDRGEMDLVEKIRNSIKTLSQLKDEFKNSGLLGTFEVYTYSHFPYCYVLLVDPKEANGRAYVSHYMHATKRADTPIIEIHKASNPVLFEKYDQMVQGLLATCVKV